MFSDRIFKVLVFIQSDAVSSNVPEIIYEECGFFAVHGKSRDNLNVKRLPNVTLVFIKKYSGLMEFARCNRVGLKYFLMHLLRLYRYSHYAKPYGRLSTKAYKTRVRSIVIILNRFKKISFKVTTVLCVLSDKSIG